MIPRKTSTALWLIGLGLSTGVGCLAFFVLAMKMDWAGNEGNGLAVSLLSLAFGCFLGIWAWIVIFTGLKRRWKQ